MSAVRCGQRGEQVVEAGEVLGGEGTGVGWTQGEAAKEAARSGRLS